MKTEIIPLEDRKCVRKAVEILEKGGIVVYPTETSYGIGADATNDEAVLKVYKIKKRDRDKKILVAFSDIRMAKKYLVIGADAKKLAEEFMPGPLSLIVRSKNGSKVGFRIPDNKTILSIIRSLKKPITTTSANISGNESLYKIKDIINIFDSKVDMIIDGGNLPKRKASTIYDMEEKKILRQGPINEKQIRSIIGQ